MKNLMKVTRLLQVKAVIAPAQFKVKPKLGEMYPPGSHEKKKKEICRQDLQISGVAVFKPKQSQ